ncbi:hypothetical protein EVAR_10043_1 [Eumeta japonica]|uniref:Uncharacterized protein n=1 Tax=Eumeta variegata TaxID=151549 RepID=A0A4C1TR65_EUMVA|nr:hypothetical protein EVAR_10043_1 [Eumeta japonica]
MKTKCIRFSLPNVRHGSGTISVRNKELEFVNSTVFLGITLDDRLQWGPHINVVAKAAVTTDVLTAACLVVVAGAPMHRSRKFIISESGLTSRRRRTVPPTKYKMTLAPRTRSPPAARHHTR